MGLFDIFRKKTAANHEAPTEETTTSTTDETAVTTDAKTS